MRIHTRDYNHLTNEEIREWERLKREEIIDKFDEIVVRKSLYRKYPVAVRHFLSLFPNNHLDIEDLKEEKKLTTQIDNYLKLINDPTSIERTILNWIKESKSYFIIASMLKNYYSFGHHDAYIIPEFQLGNTYQVDYLLIGKSSGGYEFVFVELEHPNKNITLSSGYPGESIRKGLNQITDWKSWLEKNYSFIGETFEKYKHPEKILPYEFTNYDSSRIHFSVVAGKRINFNEKTYEIKRQMWSDKILLLHYENLYDSAKYLVGQLTY